MKILHLADLHIGKKVNNFCMLKEQKFVLNQACELIKKEKIEAVLIAGDVFDRPIPPISALELLDEFLTDLINLKTKVFLIAGNHDSLDRLSFLSKFLENSNIFISQAFDGKINSIPLNKETEIYLMPYLYPALVKKYFPEEKISNYNDAIKTVIKNTKIDDKKFNIIVAHQFVIGTNEVILSQSEQKSVGGVDEVSYEIFNKFDYCALGHLHCPQKCGSENIRYAGSILKYSFSEINQNKSFCVLDIKENKELELKFHPIKPLNEMQEYRGYIDEFLNKEFYENIKTDDYFHFTLLDECVIDAKKKLSMIYPNIMLLDFDNSLTRNLDNALNPQNIEQKSLYEHFLDFYKNQTNEELDNKRSKIIEKIINEEIKCDQ